MIAALIEKDLKLYFRNRFFTVITLLGIIAFIALYYLLPAQPDDTSFNRPGRSARNTAETGRHSLMRWIQTVALRRNYCKRSRMAIIKPG